MSHRRQKHTAIVMMLTLALPSSGSGGGAGGGLQASSVRLQASAFEHQASGVARHAAAAHVLNRLTFGPRPGDVERVLRIGIQAWIDEQLYPERIGDRAFESRLARFETLTLDADTLFREYHQPAVLERRQRQRQNQADSSVVSANPAAITGSSSVLDDPGVSPRAGREAPERPDMPASTAGRRDRQIIVELEEAKILRALYSERQLEAVLTDFWFNHFNVFAGKGPTRAYVTTFERDAIRPYVLGDFRQMLEAVAKSPAMLFYLDNWMNTAEGGRPGPGAQNQPRTRSRRHLDSGARSLPRGINENYARELLELHTLGVDGGYTQADIVNLARAFTGWTFQPRQGATFRFVPALHDTAAKTVLGQTIGAGGGIEDGQKVLDILVAHPSTARFIATKLAQKFVSDTPPPALVDRAARRFTEARGNLRELTRVIVTSPEFLSPNVYRAKVKTPFEFVASALRATGVDVRTALPLARTLRDLGMPLYFCQPPTGYDEAAEPWVSSGALVARMNFALELAGGRLRGVTPPPMAGDLAALRTRMVDAALAGDMTASTRATLEKATTPEQVIALTIGSPEFQRQ